MKKGSVKLADEPLVDEVGSCIASRGHLKMHLTIMVPDQHGFSYQRQWMLSED